MSTQIVYDFEWDAAKALSNVAKHGVTFDQAATVFRDALAITVYDEVHSQTEERWFTLYAWTRLRRRSLGRDAYVSNNRAQQRPGAYHLGTCGDPTRTTFL